ncbi:hypothetical protein POTOM_051142 [Populus tomentosa]|uniref:Uncharacterized protein n=1 Tax=Populus tomentosa TaxID=118781 RepID=A0A8X7Y5J8_POPTO|nr:hypothetical protein POTOM_051142 [Populus tomentosa]
MTASFLRILLLALSFIALMPQKSGSIGPVEREVQIAARYKGTSPVIRQAQQGIMPLMPSINGGATCHFNAAALITDLDPSKIILL